MMRHMRDLVPVVCALALALASAGCARTIHDNTDDATMTARVRTALLNDPDLPGRGIAVATSAGVVTLSGRVGSKEEEQQAIAVARRIHGVREVRSSLQVQRTPG